MQRKTKRKREVKNHEQNMRNVKNICRHTRSSVMKVIGFFKIDSYDFIARVCEVAQWCIFFVTINKND